jgi:flagellar motor protein MotB
MLTFIISPSGTHYTERDSSVPYYYSISAAGSFVLRMTQTPKRIVFSLLVVSSIFLPARPVFAQSAPVDSASLAPSNDIATGHSYFGLDLGITGSEYIGSKNFLWGIVTSRLSGNGVPEIATYLPYNSLGGGIGFVGGLKAGFALSSSFDLEAKVRFLTNHTSNQESPSSIYLDPQFPANTAPATDNYSLTLSNLDLAILGHLRLNDQWYGIGGFSLSTLTGNSFSANQQLSGEYIDLATHTQSNRSSQQVNDSSLTNWFTGYRGDLQFGAGSVFRLGSSNMLLDAELIVGIPLTTWLTKVADSSSKATATFWTPQGQTPPAVTAAIADPHLWYVSLTIGIRFPFHTLPPPLLPPAPKYDETSGVWPAPARPLFAPSATVANDSGVTLSGQVTDAKTGQPISADLTAVDLANNQVFSKTHTDSSGNYSVRVHSPGNYSVTANAPGHLFGTALFEVDSEGRILKRHSDISLGGISGGKTRMLIFFEKDKADLQPSSIPELNQAVDLMQTVPTMNVEIAGYSDSVGTLSHNVDLSFRRAKAVRDYLVEHGIPIGRVTAHGYGPMPPIAPNDTNEGRAENRRVEFVVTKN